VAGVRRVTSHRGFNLLSNSTRMTFSDGSGWKFPEMEGMLRKRGHDKIGILWTDRWCVLQDNVLKYYKKPNTPELGALRLEDCEIVLTKKGSRSCDQEISLHFDNSHTKGKDRTYHFSSEDGGYIAEWFKVLQDSKHGRQRKLEEERSIAADRDAELAHLRLQHESATKIQNLARIHFARQESSRRKWINAANTGPTEGAAEDEVMDEHMDDMLISVPLDTLKIEFRSVAARANPDEV